ncbi:proline--tRNA ligase [Nitratifractor sp.]|uniref:proline--tRNA ligase n=1 Tax=Nitratifractor sp. TaxID=2268144 RepID=UPI0025D166D0|nr:proline--tRNA ligase [Nitratifractor sp.]
MRFSRTLIPTAKEAPSDAVLPSHIYLLRAGFIQSVGAGLYNFLPLGKRSLDRVRQVVKEELDAAGCQEVDLAFVTPAELWRESGRFEKYGKELLRFTDRKENEFVLGPTHEEMMVNLVRQSVKSYKQLPLHLYQIKTKFRDEIRPRFGLMRGREFLMEDGYSFHKDEEDMKREFDHMEATYSRIFTRLGLDFRVVEADSGAIGGSGSKEFMVLADSGEDTVVVCDGCDYGANVEAATRAPREAPRYEEGEAPEMSGGDFHTPGTKTIEDLAEFFHIDPHHLIKAVAKKALYDEGREEIVLFFVRGNEELEETKAANAVGANELIEVSEEELRAAGLTPGYMGFVGLPETVRYVLDNELKGEKNLIMGANREEYHKIGVSVPDFGENFADLVTVREGDRCARCGGRLSTTRGIEVGHIFQLGTRYSEPLGATFLDENGKTRPFVMGTYGIGVSRLLAAIIEQHHDDKGCIWTRQSAPFDVEIVVSNIADDVQKEAAEKLYATLRSHGVEVLLDDRKERFGFKMKDFELIGIPLGIVVGKKLDEGLVELIVRDGLERQELGLDAVVDAVLERV